MTKWTSPTLKTRRTSSEDAEEGQQEPVKRRRGMDREWLEEGVFDKKTSFAVSEFKKYLDKEITKKCGYDTVQA